MTGKKPGPRKRVTGGKASLRRDEKADRTILHYAYTIPSVSYRPLSAVAVEFLLPAARVAGYLREPCDLLLRVSFAQYAVATGVREVTGGASREGRNPSTPSSVCAI
jgi:hypothetical protein